MALAVDYVDEIARQQKIDVLWFFFDPDHYEALDDGFVQRDIDGQLASIIYQLRISVRLLEVG